MIGKAIARLAPPLALLWAALPVLAQSPPPPESTKHDVGVLNCEVEPESASDVRELDCVFDPITDRPTETYVGRIEKLADVGGTGDKTVMTWQVLAESPNIQVGALVGVYESAVAPVDENEKPKIYLVGGVNGAIALLPLSVAADQKSLIAVVAELRLKTVKA